MFRFFKKKRFVIALYGMDGAGKTVLREALRPRLTDILGKDGVLQIAHVKPPLFAKSEPDPKGVFSKPQELPQHPLWKALLKVLYYTAMYWIQAVVPVKNASREIILYDRYLTDAWADPVRYCLPRLQDTLVLAWMMRFVPEPDVHIFVSVPADLAVARKGELSLEQAEKLADAYGDLSSQFDVARVVTLKNDEAADIATLSIQVCDDVANRLRKQGWRIIDPNHQPPQRETVGHHETPQKRHGT